MVANRGLFQPLLQGFGAGRDDVILYGPLNEAAALTGPGEAIDSADRGFRQDDIDASCHGIRA